MGEKTQNILDERKYPSGRQIMSNNYKSLFLYGTKTINLSMETYTQAIIFRDNFSIFMEEARDLLEMVVVEEKQVPSLKFPLLCLPVDLLTTSCSGA